MIPPSRAGGIDMSDARSARSPGQHPSPLRPLRLSPHPPSVLPPRPTRRPGGRLRRCRPPAGHDRGVAEEGVRPGGASRRSRSTSASPGGACMRLGVPTPTLRMMPDEFIQGMACRREILGDVGASDPARWDTIWQASTEAEDEGACLDLAQRAGPAAGRHADRCAAAAADRLAAGAGRSLGRQGARAVRSWAG